MSKMTKKERSDLLTKSLAIDAAAKAVAHAAIVNGVGVTDIIDLVRAIAFKEVKQQKFTSNEKDQNGDAH